MVSDGSHALISLVAFVAALLTFFSGFGLSTLLTPVFVLFFALDLAIACIIDFTRLSVYASRFGQAGLGENLPLVTSATLSAMAGAYPGNKLLKKITLQFLQRLVAVLLVLISLALGAGLI